MKKMLLVFFTALSTLSLTILPALATTPEEDAGMKLGFLRNIKYMGLGMLGIFVVICLVIIITIILNKVTSDKE